MIVWCVFRYRTNSGHEDIDDEYLSCIFATEELAKEYVKRLKIKDYRIEDWCVN